MRSKPTAEKQDQGELRPEYDFDYSKSSPNRFAAEFRQDCLAVVLEPDVAAVFRDAATVNALLRSVISALPAGASASRRVR